MLVLTRHVGEVIRIGDDIEVIVLGIDQRGDVRLGFNAPKAVPLHREEVFEKIKAQSHPP